MTTGKNSGGPLMGIAEALLDIMEILHEETISRADAPDNWERMVGIIAEDGSLPVSELQIIEDAIAEAYSGWSDAERRSIWYETDSGMADAGDDEDDDSPCDTSFNGIGYALQVEMLDEVTGAILHEAEKLKKASKKGAVGA